MLFFILTDNMYHRRRFNHSTNSQVKVITPVLRRKSESSNPKNTTEDFAQRVKEVVARLNITMVQIEDWFVLQRSTFDVNVLDEPYSALHLYINVKTRAFITRVWGRTHSKGDIGELSEVDEICRQSFAEGGLVCCPGHREVSNQDNLLIVEYPFHRMVALDCDVLHAKPGGQGSVKLCNKCVTSVKGEENCDQNIGKENGDPDIVEVEVEAKIHEVITVEDDETKHPVVHDVKVTKDKVNGPILELHDDFLIERPLDDGPVEEPLEDDSIEESLEDNIFSDGKRTSSPFRKPFLKPNQRMNYAMLAGKKKPVARQSEKPTLKKPRVKRNYLFPHIRRYPRFWKYNIDGSASKIKCEHCGQVLGGGAHGKRNHFVRFHNWGNFFCSQCKFFAFYPNEFASHLLEKHPGMEGGVAATCPVCEVRISLTTNGGENDPFSEHYKECALGAIKLHSKRQRESPGLQSKKPVVCDICGKTVLMVSLPLHMETHKKREPIECSFPGCTIRCISQVVGKSREKCSRRRRPTGKIPL